MADEIEVVRPLDAAEIKDAIAQTIAEAVRFSLDKTCHLYGQAYPKFKATWRVDITLSRSPGAAEWPEDETSTFVNGDLPTAEFSAGIPTVTGKAIEDAVTSEVKGEIPYAPPNAVRKKNGMPVPTVVKRDDGSQELKAVVFRRTKGAAYVGTTIED